MYIYIYNVYICIFIYIYIYKYVYIYIYTIHKYIYIYMVNHLRIYTRILKHLYRSQRRKLPGCLQKTFMGIFMACLWGTSETTLKRDNAVSHPLGIPLMYSRLVLQCSVDTYAHTHTHIYIYISKPNHLYIYIY